MTQMALGVEPRVSPASDRQLALRADAELLRALPPRIRLIPRRCAASARMAVCIRMGPTQPLRRVQAALSKNVP